MVDNVTTTTKQMADSQTQLSNNASAAKSSVDSEHRIHRADRRGHGGLFGNEALDVEPERAGTGQRFQTRPS